MKTQRGGNISINFQSGSRAGAGTDFQTVTDTLSWVVFYSPTILIFIITFLSFVFQNFKGLIYLGFIIAISILRIYVYGLTGHLDNMYRADQQCSAAIYGNYGNLTYSVFIFSFTMMYLFLPMFLNNAANWWIFSAFVAYAILDMFIRSAYGCYSAANMISEILLNIICGCGLSAGIVMAMYAGGSSKFLFFNEMNTGTDTCSRPANQQFKCKAYKNGELLGTVPHP